MELFMDIIRMVMYLVWTVVGIMTIGMGVVYHQMMKPIMKPMTKMYTEMYKEYEEA